MPSPSARAASAPLVATASGWNDDSALLALFGRTCAFPLRPGSADAARLLELDAGGYTVHVAAAPGEARVAMVEIYKRGCGGSAVQPPLLRLVSAGAVRFDLGVGCAFTPRGFWRSFLHAVLPSILGRDGLAGHRVAGRIRFLIATLIGGGAWVRLHAGNLAASPPLVLRPGS